MLVMVGAVLSASLSLVLVLLCVVYFVRRRAHSDRRRKLDREMMARVERRARMDREMQERVNAIGSGIYLDPEEPYQERCIM